MLDSEDGILHIAARVVLLKGKLVLVTPLFKILNDFVALSALTSKSVPESYIFCHSHHLTLLQPHWLPCFLDYDKHNPAIGPLHMLFLLQENHRLMPSFSSDLCSHVSLSETP